MYESIFFRRLRVIGALSVPSYAFVEILLRLEFLGVCQQVLNPGKHTYRSEMEMITRGGWFDAKVSCPFVLMCVFL